MAVVLPRPCSTLDVQQCQLHERVRVRRCHTQRSKQVASRIFEPLLSARNFSCDGVLVRSNKRWGEVPDRNGSRRQPLQLQQAPFYVAPATNKPQTVYLPLQAAKLAVHPKKPGLHSAKLASG